MCLSRDKYSERLTLCFDAQSAGEARNPDSAPHAPSSCCAKSDAWLFLKSGKPLLNALNPSARPYLIPFLVIWSSRRRFEWDNLTD